MTKPLNSFDIFMLFLCLTTFSISILLVNGENYVQEACSVTRYQDLCIKSLASYSNTAKKNPSRWARAGVSVTIREVKIVSQYLNKLKKHSQVKSKNKGALSDCIECIQDSLDNLHQSLGVLRRLSIRRFDEQMNDVLTWLSASLTDQDTCIDGFEDQRGKQVIRLCNKVQNASFITSNALALVNKLATTGLQAVGDDP